MSSRSRAPILLVTLAVLLPLGCPEDDGDGRDAAPDGGDGRLFSFVILTDLHVGEGFQDYGTAGVDDSGGDEYELTATLRAAVQAVNDGAAEHDVAFVVVTGDLTDSGERSEMVRSREILEGLEVPWLPVIGNHDIWPYTRSGEEAEAPVGDERFEEVFGEHIDAVGGSFDGFARAPGPVDNPEHDISSRFINYAFDYEGRHFVVLDLVTRAHAREGELGVNSEAALHDFEGGTWPWLEGQLSGYGDLEDDSVFLFSHHPPLVTFPGSDCLTEEAHAQVEALIRGGGYEDAIYGFFAGHHHLDYVDTDYAGQQVVVSGATKEGARPRLIQIFADGRVEVESFL